MPIYKLKCDACGEEYEDLRNVSDQEEIGPCISCGADDIKRMKVIVEDCCGCPVSGPGVTGQGEPGPGCEC